MTPSRSMNTHPRMASPGLVSHIDDLRSLGGEAERRLFQFLQFLAQPRLPVRFAEKQQESAIARAEQFSSQRARFEAPLVILVDAGIGDAGFRLHLASQDWCSRRPNSFKSVP